MTIERLEAAGERQREAADQFCEAAQSLARETNGIGFGVLPAPVAYDILGNLKIGLGYLVEVARFMPTGLRNSQADHRLEVYDKNPWTGEDRNPSFQVNLAGEHLTEVLNYLNAAVEAAEDAQVALNSQGYNVREA